MLASSISLDELEEDLPIQLKTKMRDDSWISTETWRLIDQKAEARRRQDVEAVDVLKRQVRAAVRGDRRKRAEEAAATAESFLKEGKIQEAFEAIKGWYKDVTDLPPKPTYHDEAKIRREFEALFSRVEPEGEPIPLHYEGDPINDGPPTEVEVVQALKRLRFGKSPGVSGIRAEDLRQWHKLAREPEENAVPFLVDVRRWEKILELVDMAFTSGTLPKAFCNGILVLIPKSTNLGVSPY